MTKGKKRYYKKNSIIYCRCCCFSWFDVLVATCSVESFFSFVCTRGRNAFVVFVTKTTRGHTAILKSSPFPENFRHLRCHNVFFFFFYACFLVSSVAEIDSQKIALKTNLFFFLSKQICDVYVHNKRE